MGLRQVLPLAGAFFFGQTGFVVGSLIGNFLDPQVIKTPRIKDLPVQTSGEGGFRQVVYGTCWVNDTNILDFGDVRRVTVKERQGKGGGPVVESERLYRTYAIGLGEPLEAIRVIRRDGKIVYDVRPGSTILADSAAFAERFRFYSGAEDQLPDPDLEALPHNGVGNTPYYRGTAYLVFPNDDLTDTQGRIPTYEVEGVAKATVPAQGTWFYGPVAENGPSGGSELFYLKADSPGDFASATPVAIPSGLGNLARFSSANGAVFSHGNLGSYVSFDNGASWTACSETLPTNYPVYWNGDYYWCGLRRSADGITWEAVPNIGVNAVAILMARDSDGAVAYSSTDRTIYVSMDNAATWTLKRTSIWEVSHGMSATNGSRIWWTEDSTRGLYTDNLFENANNTYGTAFQEYTPYYGGGFVITKANNRLIRTPEDSDVGVIVQDPFLYGAREAQNIAYGGGGLWAAEYSTNDASSPKQREIWVSSDFGETWASLGFTLYGNGGSLVYVENSGLPTVDSAPTTLSAVVDDVCDRCGLLPGEYDMSALSDVVAGVTLGGDYSGADSITTLMPAYFFDIPQPEKVLKGVKRGGATVVTITEDDLVEEPDENILRGQDIEYPRLLMLRYLNPGQNYSAPAATVSRNSPDIRVQGEATADLPISFDETGALRVADRMLKVMWEDLNGEVTFAVPAGPFAYLSPSDCVGLSLRGGLYRIRIEKIEEAEGVLKISGRRDRQSAYTSNLTAIALPDPTPPPPSQPGDTTFVLMNLPALVDGDDALGIYIAMTGDDNSAWAGAQVAYRVQGDTDWIVIGSYSRRATMGVLTATLPDASPYYTDYTNTLSVQLHNAADQLDTVSDSEFLREYNGCAIVNADGTAEIVQFKTATDMGDGAWDLTTLQRGRLNTQPLSHASGKTFVELANAIFLPLPSALIGQTLEFRVTSLGTSPETAPTASIVWNPAYSQYEFAPEFLELERSGGTISGSWSPRHRFGTDVNPVVSVNFTGYTVTLTDGTTTQTIDTTSPSFSTSDSAFVGTITVSVTQNNRYTGSGPALVGSI